MDWRQKYLKYKNKYLQLKNMLGGDFETDIAKDGVVLIKGVQSDEHKLTENLPKIEEYIKKQIKQNFIKNDEEVNELYTFINRCIKFLLFKYNDKDKEDFKQKYDLTDEDVGKINAYGKYELLNSDNTELKKEFIYNNTSGLSGKWKELPGLWFFINGFTDDNVFEKLYDGKTWLVIDRYFVQFMFFTNDGIMKISIFPDPKKINFEFATQNATYNKEKEKDPSLKPPEPELPNDADILIRFDKTSFLEEYTEDFAELLNKEKYVDKPKMKEVAEYMYKYHNKKQTKFVALLGKARFWVDDTCILCRNTPNKKCDKIKKHTYDGFVEHIFYEPTNKTAAMKAYEYTKEIMSGLLFRNCNIGIITGGYSGIVASECGITRTGYEVAKHYEKPVVTIMCNAGRFDKNKHSDAIGYYGMHWGDDTKALSSFADGAVMISPFGAWSQVELFFLSYKKKPCAIYLDKLYIAKIIELINTYKTQLKVIDGQIINLQQIFLTSKVIPSKNWKNKDITISIGEEVVKHFGLGGADHFGLNILFKNVNFKDKKLECNEKIKSFISGIIGAFTLWYPHYIEENNQTIENGIPVFTDYPDLTRYMTEKLYENQNYLRNKNTQLQKILNGEIKKPELTLNRDWERPFNPLIGSYSPDSIILNRHSDE